MMTHMERSKRTSAIKMNKIQFKDLSGWLKALVILGWISVGINALAFMYGFTLGFLGL